MQKKAVESGFYKRSSKLLPAKFFDILLYSASINGPCSLNHSICEIDASFDISISKQGLDCRYNESTVAFVRSILEEQISKQLDGSVERNYFNRYARVRVKDATRFDLPDRLKENFLGYGGMVTSQSAVAIQYEFDVKNGKLLDLSFTSAKRTDYQDARENADDIAKGDLVIRDLGYFNTTVLQKIISKQAFFISRLHTKILVYGSNEELTSFSELYQKMVKKNQSHLVLDVLIGKKEKVPVRLVVDLMPEEIYQRRVRKAQAEARKKGFKTDDEFKARAHFNLLITNIPKQDMDGLQVYHAYKVRWQIELIFKIWKSTCGIDKIHPMKYHRIMCLFYAKLILFLINHQVIGLVQRSIYREKWKLLSRDKCFKTLTRYYVKTRLALFSPVQRIPDYIESIGKMLSKNHYLEKRKNRINYLELFALFSSISDK